MLPVGLVQVNGPGSGDKPQLPPAIESAPRQQAAAMVGMPYVWAAALDCPNPEVHSQASELLLRLLGSREGTQQQGGLQHLVRCVDSGVPG